MVIVKEFIIPLNKNQAAPGRSVFCIYKWDYSYQKGAIEENHELVRYFIPKYTVFDNLNQNQATLMACHINSLFRESIETSPVDLAATYFGEEFLNKIGIRAIDPDSVVMNPSIFLNN